MAKSGTPRHSKPARNPVTINLDPSDVKRVDEAAKATPEAEPVGNFPESGSPKPEAAKPVPPKTESTSAEKTAKAEKPESSTYAKPPFTSGVKPETQQPVQKGSAGASHLLAGVAGGVIALGGLLALQWGNVIPSPGAKVTAEQLAHMEQQIADLRSNPTPAPLDDASRAQLAALEKNVQAAEIKAEAVAGSFDDLQQQVAALPKEAGQQAAADTTALTERLDALESKLSAAQNRADEATAGVTGNTGTISSLESKLTSLQEKVTQASRQPDATVLIAANALKMAIDRGGSFKAELDTYASIAPDEGSIERLRSFADKGVPTVADLNAWFGAVANRIVATENKLSSDAGIWDQLVASAKGLVSVRPVAGNVSGVGVGPITARMEAALQAGDLERALSEWEQLPADAKAASQEFADQMRARRDADALVQRLVADSLKPKASADETGGAPASSGQ
ncbi:MULTISPECIES: mitofilin family membrane protein [unclassified Ochrobactrum]|uniref:COG4223 family protein n=1 Tax=unclassified Ochrobactrum TaxID=239106 RepID=UPI000DEFADC8|nr:MULTISPECIES: mitofilin family membrane protein [unclassified Ochrobactrum]MBQ0710593.1 COG4223 family protein [Ochrobactrum sp. AP1BH01-1]